MERLQKLTYLFLNYDFGDYLVVNHSKNFVDSSNNEVFAQNIEAFWSFFKRHLKTELSKYIRKFDQHFAEIMYRKTHLYGFFMNF